MSASCRLLLGFILILCGSLAPAASRPTSQLPDRLSDQEFWRLVEDLSEPGGTFQSDNLLSNEMVFARILPDLVAQTKPGGVYLGVGPEQNFTYIAAMKPRIAFITDIRRGNLHLQLMYKALFELSADRAEFASRLFTKPRTTSLTATSTASELMTAYSDAPRAGEAAYAANLEAIRRHLTRTHSLPLSSDDLDGIARVYRAFFWYGPDMIYAASASLTPVAHPGVTYRDLMVQADSSGQELSYLASEEKFRFVKDLETRNLVVPVVGNFSGPTALRAIGGWLKQRNVTVTAFYLSNVEQYLNRDATWPAFCANVATFPLDDASVFIRPTHTSRPNGQGAQPVRHMRLAGTNRTFTFITARPAVIAPPPPVNPWRTSGNLVFASRVTPIAEEVKTCGVRQ